MSYDPIVKQPVEQMRVKAHLIDYEEGRGARGWSTPWGGSGRGVRQPTPV